ncbi:hypothetical protein NEUTE2DRAFT_142381, partial [Neurospora tetrasperma FGSC 2509]
MPMIFIFCECTSACNNSHILPTSQSRQQRQGRRHDGRKRKVTELTTGVLNPCSICLVL